MIVIRGAGDENNTFIPARTSQKARAPVVACLVPAAAVVAPDGTDSIKRAGE